jgi:hypothetical protein
MKHDTKQFNCNTTPQIHQILAYNFEVMFKEIRKKKSKVTPLQARCGPEGG